MLERRVRPGILKRLPLNNPDAIRSRSDKITINAFMGNHGWVIRQVRRYVKPKWKITELGAGDGYLSLQIVRKGLCATSNLHGVDLIPQPPAWPSGAVWTQGDLFKTPLPPSQILVANFLLHHFSPDQLKKLGEMIPDETQMVLAVEPARYKWAAFLGKCWGLLAQLNLVTRRDLQTSFRAGFRGYELPNWLGLGNGWQIVVQESVLGSYRMMALRVKDGEAHE